MSNTGKEPFTPKIVFSLTTKVLILLNTLFILIILPSKIKRFKS